MLDIRGRGRALERRGCIARGLGGIGCPCRERERAKAREQVRNRPCSADGLVDGLDERSLAVISSLEEGAIRECNRKTRQRHGRWLRLIERVGPEATVDAEPGQLMVHGK